MGGWSSGAWVDRMHGLAGLLGEPQHAQQSIHITGTNGEGSTVRMVTALLAAHDLSVGTYTSPDLDRINERLSRHGESIDDAAFAAALEAIADAERVSGLVTIEGLDSSIDMLDRCRRAAAEQGVDVVVHHQAMESMGLARTYRSIFLAGPTFNLLADDDTASRVLLRISEHLEPGGAALIPLFVPTETPAGQLGRPREVTDPDGSVLRVTAVAEERDEVVRRQTTVLRYERITADTTTVVERPWILHWHTQAGFRELATSAGLRTSAVLDAAGAPATEAAEAFAFWLTPL